MSIPHDSEGGRYPVNTTLRILKHTPPPPFGYFGDNPRPRPDLSRWEGKTWRDIDLFDLALADPPLETTSPGPLERTLTVTDIKTLRTNGGPNVVACFLDSDPATEYIAKIYDGLDYHEWDPESETDMVDLKWRPEFMTQADQDYCTEAAAYRTMQPRIGTMGIVPTYHGSWTFCVGRDGPGHELGAGDTYRWVRMVLMERIHGDCMLTIITNAEDVYENLDYSLLPPEPFRLRVLQHIIEAFKFAHWYGMVRHMDYVPRNFIVRPDSSVVLIDFNDSFSEELAARGPKHPRLAGPTILPPSPIQDLFSVSSMVKPASPWYEWMPEGWSEDEDMAEEWLIETFRGDTRFAPVDETWLNSALLEKWCSDRIICLLESLGRKPDAGRQAGQP